MSCTGTIAVSATDVYAARIRPQAMSVRSCSRGTSSARSRSSSSALVEPAARGVVVVRAGVDDGAAARSGAAGAGCRPAPKANCRIFMPGRPIARRSSCTSAVMKPRSSATSGSSPSAVADRVEQRVPGPGHPAPVHRGRLARGDLPVRREAAEVVEAHDVREAQVRAARARSTSESVSRISVPAVERIAPALAGRAEVVGRHAGDDGRLAVVVELEQLAVAPDVGAVAARRRSARRR